MKLLSTQEVQSLLLELMKKVHAFMDENHLEYYLLGGSALGAIRHNGFIPWDDDIDIGLLRPDYERFLELSDQFDGEYEIVNFKKAKNCDFGLTRIYFPDTYIDVPSISETRLDKRLYFDIFPLDNVPDDAATLAKYEKSVVRKKKIIQLIDVRDYGNPKIELWAKKMFSFLLRPFRRCILRSFDRLLKKYSGCETQRICSLCSQYSFQKQVMLKTTYGKPMLHQFEDTELYIPENIDLYLATLFGDFMQLPPDDKRRPGFDIYILGED